VPLKRLLSAIWGQRNRLRRRRVLRWRSHRRAVPLETPRGRRDGRARQPNLFFVDDYTLSKKW